MSEGFTAAPAAQKCRKPHGWFDFPHGSSEQRFGPALSVGRCYRWLDVAIRSSASAWESLALIILISVVYVDLSNPPGRAQLELNLPQTNPSERIRAV